MLSFDSYCPEEPCQCVNMATVLSSPALILSYTFTKLACNFKDF